MRINSRISVPHNVLFMAFSSSQVIKWLIAMIDQYSLHDILLFFICSLVLSLSSCYYLNKFC